MELPDENEFFRQATLRISSSLNSETAMQRCMDYLKCYIPISGMFYGVYDTNLNVGRLIAAIWPTNLSKPTGTMTVPKAYWGWMREQLAKKEGTRIINDIDVAEEPLQQILTSIGLKNISHLSMELHLDEMLLGTLHLFAEGKHRYKESHANLISLLHDPFAIAMSNILQHQEILRLKDMLADDNNYLRRQLMEMTGDTIIGADFGLRGVMEMVHQVAPLNSPVLLMGETGVGKEVIANAIHFSSTRQNNPFIRVNCGAIPENLIDSELFGHEKGAFTGAISRKRGRFERAHTGSIFLDEVGELPPAAQVRLLRVLQQREIERVGGAEVIPVDVRIISATHQNLETMVQSGKFREDLWFRLNVFPIIIPPLRQRIDDIPALISHFVERKSREHKIERAPMFTKDNIENLQAYHWPGNVRELENFVERTLIQTAGGKQVVEMRFNGPAVVHGSVPEVSCSQNKNHIMPLDEATAIHIKKALVATKGKVEGKDGAAHLLRLHPSTLRGRMRKLGIPHGKGIKFPKLNS